jgi:hypothetical protein
MVALRNSVPRSVCSLRMRRPVRFISCMRAALSLGGISSLVRTKNDLAPPGEAIVDGDEVVFAMHSWSGKLACCVEVNHLQRSRGRMTAGLEGRLDSLPRYALLADLRKRAGRPKLWWKALHHALPNQPVQSLRTQMCQTSVIQLAQLINRLPGCG